VNNCAHQTCYPKIWRNCLIAKVCVLILVFWHWIVFDWQSPLRYRDLKWLYHPYMYWNSWSFGNHDLVILIAKFQWCYHYLKFFQSLRSCLLFATLRFRRAVFPFKEIIYAFLPNFQTLPFCVYVKKGGSSASLSDAPKSFTDFTFQLYLFVFY